MSKYLLMLIGLARSGKSTFANNLRIFPIVNLDAIRKAIHGLPYLENSELLIKTFSKYMIDSLFINHNIVILDSTNLTFEKREFYQSDKYHIIYFPFITFKHICKKRTKNKRLRKVIDKQYKETNFTLTTSNNFRKSFDMLISVVTLELYLRKKSEYQFYTDYLIGLYSLMYSVNKRLNF